MTAWFNRKRLFDEIFDPNLEPSRKASILRMANNVPVQGTAADYLKLAEVQMYDYIRNKGWYKQVNGFPMVRMMLSIHDEIIISAHQSIPTEEIVEMITNCMQIPVEGAPPFFVQPARMSSWADHSDDSIAMPIQFRDDVISEYNKTGVSKFKHSYFKLVIPENVAKEINSISDEATPNIVLRYYKQCTLEFLHGDYVKEFSSEHVKEALLRYVESGTIKYRIDNYRELLKEFRDTQLRDYMTDLIRKHGTDYKVVGENVRHPSLTHSLLDVYSKELKGKDLTHEERITEATKLYLEELLSNDDEQSSFVFDLKPTHYKESDKDLFINQLEASVNFDENGEVVFEGEEEDDFDYVESNFDVDPESVIERIENTPIYVWEFGDIITLDVQLLKPDDVNKMLSYVYERSDTNGFYKVYIIYQNKLIDTKMRVEKFDIDEANNLVMKLGEEMAYGYAFV